MERLEKVDQNNAVLLIEKPQLNHATSESVVKMKITNLAEDVNINEFNVSNNSDSDNNNHKVDKKSDEHTILCEKE